MLIYPNHILFSTATQINITACTKIKIMSIITVTIKALKETFVPKRIIPFFLLNFTFALAAFIFLMPLTNLLFQLTLHASEIQTILSKISTAGIILLALNSFALIFVALVVAGVYVWFVGALIYDVITNKGFSRGLKYSKKFYLRMLGIYIIVFAISSLSFLLATIPFGSLLQLVIGWLVSWIFLFPIPSIIIKKDSMEFAIMRSMSLISSFKLETLLFLFFTYFVRIALFFAPVAIVVLLFPAPFVDVLANIPDVANQSAYNPLPIIYSLLTNYTAYLIFSATLAFSFTISTIFIYAVKTHYFVELMKRKLSA